MKPTDIGDPNYFHKVVDCQWACPAHTPVPEYIRMIAAGRYDDAYMVNWRSNVFPGILGRTCDRPCEPACRRGRVEDDETSKTPGKKEPVAICRLKRVTADFKTDITGRLPPPAAKKNGKRVALVGAGPASLTVARDLAPLGYHCVLFDGDKQAGGMIRTQIPKFRLPESVIDEEVGYVTGLGMEMRLGERIDSLKALLAQGFDVELLFDGRPFPNMPIVLYAENDPDTKLDRYVVTDADGRAHITFDAPGKYVIAVRHRAAAPAGSAAAVQSFTTTLTLQAYDVIPTVRAEPAEPTRRQAAPVRRRAGRQDR